ncbi:MAG TPA: hypothetical protein VGB12_00575 [bacterium]|jgi:hypothetical protein
MNFASVNTADEYPEGKIATTAQTVFRTWRISRKSACPPIESLHAYAMDVLPAPQKESLERHFVACDGCLETAAVARSIDAAGVDETDTPLQATKPADLVIRWRRGIFEVLSTNLKLEWLSEPVMVRGHVVPRGAHFQCYKTTKQMVTLLEMSPSEHGAANLQVSLPDAPAPYQPPIEVRIYANGREFASSSTNGEPILFEDLIPAKWMVRVYREGVMIGETHIELQD